MVLSDKEIMKELLKGELKITPLTNAQKQIGSSSIDIRLGTEFRYLKIVKQTHFDLTGNIDEIEGQINRYSEIVHVKPLEPFILHPGDFVLASTLEYIVIPRYLTARLEGRSTWGRVGLQIHSTAGFVDPGFQGSLTFELNNLGKLPLPLYPGIRISQLSFHKIDGAMTMYSDKEGSGFSNVTRTKSSTFFKDYDYQNILKNANNAKTKS
jgi:dCTP deaminase